MRRRPGTIRFAASSTVVAVVVVFAALDWTAAGTAASPSRGRLVWISWASGGSFERWFTVRGDGAGYRELPGNPAPLSVALSPDGRRVVSTEFARIVIRNAADGSRPKVLARNTSGQSIDWSPDGRRIAYASTQGVWTVAVDGSSRRLIAPIAGISSVAWSPTGRQLAFVRNFDAAGVRQYEGDIWVVMRDGRGLRHIATRYWYSDERPSWSPDGQRIAFSSAGADARADPTKRAFTMYALNVHTGRKVVLGPGYKPSFSPDGTRIAFLVGFPGPGPWRLGISSATGRARRLLVVRWVSGPIWSPDGTEVAGSGYTINGLVAVGADGSAQRKLARLNGDIQDRLDWSG